ncbi:zf-C3HC-domain-containing protein [Ascodesmis nigricans]|uniref:Zf-C3HC-domain-containing protein n=1 Tax=Ascodesmis nigricans TaxID=341454 RepID=A0A4S2N7K6_9PEZI|nr:zf-C3HC-domain-containing protein [Ascodesmis nigricans]
MLYSTKRKWDKLITSASSPTPSTPLPPSTLHSSPSDLDLKKRRLAELGVTDSPSVRAVSPTPSHPGGTVGTGTTTTVFRPSPSYAPWDRDAFLARLATFRFVDKWPAKPTEVNEVAWAKRGWVCIDKDRVRCGACRKEVVVKVELEDESEDGKELVQRVKAGIVDEHEDGCLWRQKGCDETIQRLPVTNPALATPAFIERYNSLMTMKSDIPEKLAYPSNLNPSGLYYPEEISPPISESAAVLALFGWEATEPGIPSLVTCKACFRRLGLWLFNKRPATEGTGTQGDDDGDLDPAVSRLDPLHEHRDFCPWISAAAQSGPSTSRKLAAWEVLARILERPPKSSAASRRGSMHSVRSVFSTRTVDTVGTTGTTGTTGTEVDEETGEKRELTQEEREKREMSRMKKLKRLKSLYFGKRKSRGEEGKEKGTKSQASTRPNTGATEGTGEGNE